MIQRSTTRRSCIVLLMLLSAVVVSTAARAQTTLFNGVEVPGVVIAHSPASSGLYLGSPSIAIMPNGDYVASHDIFGPNSNSSTAPNSKVYRSTDQGQTWTFLTTIANQFYGSLFVHQDVLYLFGTNRVNGDLTIRRSTNAGATWTTPTSSTTGLLQSSSSALGYHTSTLPVVVTDGRLWRTFETRDRTTGNSNDMSAALASIHYTANLLNAANWSFTNQIMRQENWLPNNGFVGWREGNAVVDRSGNVVNILRVDRPTGASEKAAIVHTTSTTSITFNPAADIIDFNGGAKKFVIRYHEATDSYWALSNVVTPENYVPTRIPGTIRNMIALVRSDDLVHWQITRVLLKDLSDVADIGFQYVDWQFDGNDIVAVSRTGYPDGLGGADSAHNANFFTFHRFQSFVHGGDANFDDQVNLADLQILGDHWGDSGVHWSAGDFNNDGLVNLADLQILGDHWGQNGAPDLSFAQALEQVGLTIPEPAAAIVLSLGGLVLPRRAPQPMHTPDTPYVRIAPQRSLRFTSPWPPSTLSRR
ncbi:MAG: exo-alpha-sialidase [Phycisphaeraceae bacterium]|nr:exo-alpha-sialidase [Phycisphaeraceae bacterium]